MTAKYPLKPALHLLALLIALALSACTTQGTTPGPASPEGPAEQDPTPAEVQATPIPIPVVETVGPGSFDLPDPLAGLADFSSYRATLQVSFDGVRGGQPVQWAETYTMLVSSQPAARQVIFEQAGQAAETGAFPLLLVEMDGMLYERRGENGLCSASLSTDDDALARHWEPAAALLSLFGADDAGSETVNEVPARHYSFDQRALILMDNTKSEGGVWVAEDGGHVVRYLLSITAGADYFGDGQEGTMTLEYNLFEVNQPQAIPMPEGCPPAPVSAPLMSGAANVQHLPGLMTYELPAADLEEVLAFYQAELPALGWEVVGEPYITETTGVLGFTQDARQLTVIAAAGESQTLVQIAVSVRP